MDLFLATRDGFIRATGEGERWEADGRGLDDHHVTCLIAREGVILVGTKDGIFRSEDRGDSWQEASQGLSIRHIRWLAYQPDVSDSEFAGTEPAGIFVSRNGGDSWHGRPEVTRLRDENGWYLPYSPEAGAVRGFAFHGQRGYAAVEQGGVLRTDDGGETWRLVQGSTGEVFYGRPPAGQIHPDVHSIEAHPSSADLVVAPTGGGLYRSDDGGAVWTRLDRNSYVRAAWLDPATPQRMVAGLADSVDRNGRIEQSLDGGRTWQPASEGLDVPWPRHMVERFLPVGEMLLAVLSNGRLMMAAQADLVWQPLLAELGDVNAAAVMG